ncbi:MAG: sugar transporter, partial [Marinilabiliales bacterium]
TLHYSLDLTKKETLTGDHLYLMPNDILYINPVKAYAFQANGPSISIVLSFLSATVSIVTLTTLLLR